MAVYHYHAKYRDHHHVIISFDGLIDKDEEPSPKGDWLDDVRAALAEAFGENVCADSVQILSLTRISG